MNVIQVLALPERACAVGLRSRSVVIGPEQLIAGRGLDLAQIEEGRVFVDPLLGYAIAAIDVRGLRYRCADEPFPGRTERSRIALDSPDPARDPRPAQPAFDWNLERLGGWPECLRGDGQVIAVLDSGLTACHLRLPREPDHADFCACDAPAAETAHHSAHGTRCAGAIAARMPVGQRIAVAPEARLIAARITRRGLRAATGLCDVLLMLSWCIHRWSARVINLSVELSTSSLSRQGDPALLGVVATRLRRLDRALVFCAAGDTEDALIYPARLPGMVPVAGYHIAVGGAPVPSLLLQRLARSHPDLLLGPAIPRVTTTPCDGDSAQCDRLHATFGGSSAACAFASGMAALYLQRHPDLSLERVLDRMKQQAEVIRDPLRPDHRWRGLRFPQVR